MPGGIEAPVPGGTNGLSGNEAPIGPVGAVARGLDELPGALASNGPLGALPVGLLDVPPDDGARAPSVDPSTDRGLPEGESGLLADKPTAGDEGKSPGWAPMAAGRPD